MRIRRDGCSVSSMNYGYHFIGVPFSLYNIMNIMQIVFKINKHHNQPH